MRRYLASLLVLLALVAFCLQPCALAEARTAGGQEPASEASFVLPSSLQVIDEEAFSGNAVSTVILPDGFLWIESDAFACNPSLTDVYIPETVRHIADTSFPTDGDIVVHGIEGSLAEEWAEEHRVSFVAEDIWKHILDNSETVNIHGAGVDPLNRMVSPDRTRKIVPGAEHADESKRPQDRPELNPIDYRFP